MKTVISIATLAVLVGLGAVYYTRHVSGEPTRNFHTAEIERGDLSSTISATGTVEPEEVVDVGAQVAGKIEMLGPDPRGETDPRFKDKTIDYRSPVHKGSVLAVIDDAVYRAQRDQAQASVARAKADLTQAEVKLKQASQDLKRAEELRALPGNIKGIADTDYDLVVANHDAAQAAVDVAKAAVAQQEAALQLAQTNLDYTIIHSPVEGVIVERRVNVGQTVVASLNAPSLFLIAKDLRKMQVWASVNEADIGRIHQDMPVEFSVDAFPGEVFHGKVEQIRLNATMTQNVVTYTVVVAFDNSDGKVLPYLTANLKFVMDRRHDVLLVPNAALRWQPQLDEVAPDAREKAAPLLAQAAGADKRPAGQGQSDGKPHRRHVWVENGNFVAPLEVEVGLTDGTTSEVSGGGLQEGTKVVIGESHAENLGAMSNPFAPKIFGRKKKS